MSDQTFERTTLGGKDREQLQAIASAVGLKGVSRLKKADLVDAIVGASGDKPKSGGGSRSAAPAPAREPAPAPAPEKKRIRSARASELDPISKIAAEEDALAARSGSKDEAAPPIVRPRRGQSPSSTSTTPTDGSGESSNGAAASIAVSTEITTVTQPNGETTQSNHRNDHQGGQGGQGRNQGGQGRNQGGQGGQGRNQGGQGGQGRNQGGQGGQGRNQGGQGQQSARQPDDDWQEGGSKSRRNRRRGRTKDGREPMPDVDLANYQGEIVEIAGVLDLRDEGYGFLRGAGFQAGRNDSYVSATQVRKFAMRKGDHIQGGTRPASTTEKYPALVRVDLINGMTPDDARNRARFEDLTPLFPDMQLRLELPDNPLELTGRIIDLVSPIGKGQRALVVSPPKAGKTTIMKHIVYAVERNNPECHVMVLLVDERPEEVTDMKRHVLRAEVVSSTFDRPSDEHCHVAELTIERAKRLVEMGKDVVIVLDGITRLARAYNLSAPATGRIMSGGIDAGALYPPKKFFGAARNVEEGGSLTIIATALVETNSKMDEHIFEEFKGTGNMELRLDRRLSDRRIYPSIDVEGSGTRQEQLLFERNQLQQVWKLRRVLAALDSDRGDRDGPSGKGLELLIEKLRTTATNAEFLHEISKTAN